jgi:hypothetical protein
MCEGYLSGCLQHLSAKRRAFDEYDFTYFTNTNVERLIEIILQKYVVSKSFFEIEMNKFGNDH